MQGCERDSSAAAAAWVWCMCLHTALLPPFAQQTGKAWSPPPPAADDRGMFTLRWWRRGTPRGDGGGGQKSSRPNKAADHHSITTPGYLRVPASTPPFVDQASLPTTLDGLSVSSFSVSCFLTFSATRPTVISLWARTDGVWNKRLVILEAGGAFLGASFWGLVLALLEGNIS